MFYQRQREESLLRSQLATRIEQHQQEINGSEAQIASLRRQLALIEPERASVKELWDKQLVTINRMNQLERTAAELEGNIAALNARIAETRAKITEAQEQSIQLVESRRVKAGTDLSQINTMLNQQRLRSVAASDQHDRSDIRAPYSGTVEKIAFSAIGDVIRPAEAIMEILPDEDLMIVEVMVDPADIDQVKVGQTSQVHFTSFNRATTPEIPGKVSYVAKDRSDNPETKVSFFMVRIALDQAALKRENMALRSGMPAEVHIETGSRSLLSYFFKPLRDQLARAFNDN
jgi:HlyD family secretion protein